MINRAKVCWSSVHEPSSVQIKVNFGFLKLFLVIIFRYFVQHFLFFGLWNLFLFLPILVYNCYCTERSYRSVSRYICTHKVSTAVTPHLWRRCRWRRRWWVITTGSVAWVRCPIRLNYTLHRAILPRTFRWGFICSTPTLHFSSISLLVKLNCFFCPLLPSL